MTFFKSSRQWLSFLLMLLATLPPGGIGLSSPSSPHRSFCTNFSAVSLLWCPGRLSTFLRLSFLLSCAPSVDPFSCCRLPPGSPRLRHASFPAFFPFFQHTHLLRLRSFAPRVFFTFPLLPFYHNFSSGFCLPRLLFVLFSIPIEELSESQLGTELAPENSSPIPLFPTTHSFFFLYAASLVLNHCTAVGFPFV